MDTLPKVAHPRPFCATKSEKTLATSHNPVSEFLANRQSDRNRTNLDWNGCHPVCYTIWRPEVEVAVDKDLRYTMMAVSSTSFEPEVAVEDIWVAKLVQPVVAFLPGFLAVKPILKK
jgi:hypothetical protein